MDTSRSYNWTCNICIFSFLPFADCISDQSEAGRRVKSVASKKFFSSEYSKQLKLIFPDNADIPDKHNLLNNQDTDPDINFHDNNVKILSSYLEESKFNTFFTLPDKDVLYVIHVNCRSIVGNFNEFTTYKSNLQVLPAFIAVTETWLTIDTEDSVDLTG